MAPACYTKGPVPCNGFQIPSNISGVPQAIATAELLLFLAAGVIWWLYTEKRIKRLSQALDQVDGVVTKFTYHQLEVATDNFKDKLGAGAFGTVYKGVLADGTSLVAVK
ncbi:hypothetical protein SELMODRAFT_407253 [Selaginella moellendorffii]|uniref:Protein kinase domain-containing protein n=1 Tax=Selaginella moellendorffii TaxID=88036 RepID=D8R4F3_SELML|nr:hypothetical protein SELMODRAFT_407253 [Selaginella moellendorffii]